MNTPRRESYVVGVDVGTGSARAGIFSMDGSLVGSARHPIRIWQEPGDIVEQSSADIWAAVTRVVREAVASSGISPSDIVGLGFDATCSLVVLDGEARPLTVSVSGEPERNVIVWMDHRAVAEADEINAGGHDVLRYVGGVISPEMETPKLLWLKRNLSASYAGAGHFLDLADFLTFRATGSTHRSTCTVTCKWTYLAHEGRWSEDYFRRVGLAELAEDGFRRIGADVAAPGTPLAAGLTAAAAGELGLRAGTPVAASLIDAHAGGVGTVGARSGEAAGDPISRLAYIMGTSACLMASTTDPVFVPGVWGPYFSAMVPGLWLNEGGQSAAGVGIDHLLREHPAHAAAATEAATAGISLLDMLETRIAAGAVDLSEAARLARDVHVLPDFLGNRSPFADPLAHGVMAGLDLDEDQASLQRRFVAGLCGLAYGAADVLDALREQGIHCDLIVISGGASRSALVRQIMADATGIPVALPATPEPVLLGAAMLGAVAGGAFVSLTEAMAAMSTISSVSQPNGRLAGFHRRKRQVYRAMQQLDRDARAAMADQ